MTFHPSRYADAQPQIQGKLPTENLWKLRFVEQKYAR